MRFEADGSKEDHFYMKLKFKKPLEIYAFGIQCANDYPSMDPGSVKISVKFL